MKFRGTFHNNLGTFAKFSAYESVLKGGFLKIYVEKDALTGEKSGLRIV